MIDKTAKQTRYRFRWVPGVVLGLGVAASVVVMHGGVVLTSAHADDAPPPAAPTVPVTTTAATHRDVPVFRAGIGTVQALNSVLIRARVDGTLDSVAFTEGQMVKKGDLLAVIDPRPYQASLDQAVSKKAQDTATLENARLDLARYNTLARSDFASRQSVDTQQATVNQYTAAVQGDNAAIETAALNLSFTHITSPLDGRIGLRQIDPGNLIHATDTQGLVTVTQVQPITVLFTLPEEALPSVTSAMTNGTLPAFAYASDNRTRLSQGTLLTPDNTIDSSTGTIRLKAVFANADNRLWPGQFVSARVQIGTQRNAVTVPAAAVQRGQDGLYVFIVKDNQAKLVPVKESFEQDGTAVIAEGLNGDEQVVINGQSRLTTGTRVSATPQTTSTGS
jgi:multidrug efflux system membrane fusion protein